MNLRWSALAQSDLHALTAYYRAIDPEVSIRMRKRIEQTPSLLSTFPMIGTPLPGSHLRKLRVRGTPFLLFYRADETGIVVIRVLHSARDLAL